MHWCDICNRRIGKKADIIYSFGYGHGSTNGWIAHQKCYDKHGEPKR